MAVPKYRTSKSEKGLRRSHHALTAPSGASCPSCGEARKSHCVCKNCGYYRGKVMIAPKQVAMTDKDFTTAGDEG